MSAHRFTIEHEGQRYKDEPVYELVSKAQPLALAINGALRPEAPQEQSATLAEAVLKAHQRAAAACFSRVPTVTPRIDALKGIKRVHLNWLVPDGRGGLKSSAR